MLNTDSACKQGFYTLPSQKTAVTMWIYLTKYERPSHWIRGLGSPMLCAQKTRSADYLNIQNDFFSLMMAREYTNLTMPGFTRFKMSGSGNMEDRLATTEAKP